MLHVMKANGGGLRRMVLTATVIITAVGAGAGAGTAHAQDIDSLPLAPSDSQENRLLHRWVGAQFNRLPIWLDFFGDSMLVVSDRFVEIPADYALTPRSLIVSGNPRLMELLAVAFNPGREGEDFNSRTSFEMRYRFSLERLLIEADGVTITMSPQNVLARRIEANWIADLPDGKQMRLQLFRSESARHRIAPGGSWVGGNWKRDAREITFDWNPDSVETPDSALIWSGAYDARGDQIILESVGEGTRTTIFRRIIR